MEFKNLKYYNLDMFMRDFIHVQMCNLGKIYTILDIFLEFCMHVGGLVSEYCSGNEKKIS